MGSALLKRWLARGLRPDLASVSEPSPSEWLRRQRANGLSLNAALDDAPDVVVVATKPDLVAEALKPLAPLGNGRTVFASIAASTSIAVMEGVLGAKTPILRAMPNVPAEIGCGVVGAVHNQGDDAASLAPAMALFSAVGTIVHLDTEEQMHALTAISGSGPAYVFAMAEALEQAALDFGLPASTARKLGVQTVFGSGALMARGEATPTDLRKSVCSPGGTTEAALSVLLADREGLFELIRETTKAAHHRSAELANSKESNKGGALEAS